MRAGILLILLSTILTFALALPSADTASDVTEELLNLPLATAPYMTDTTEKDGVQGLFTNGSVTDMGDFDGRYQCETSGGSPSSEDIWGLANKFDRMGLRHCVQENPSHSMCTKMGTFHSAAVSICGPHKDWLYCFRVAFAANTIANRCRWNGLAGGYFVFDDPSSLRFPIHRS